MASIANLSDRQIKLINAIGERNGATANDISHIYPSKSSLYRALRRLEHRAIATRKESNLPDQPGVTIWYLTDDGINIHMAL